MPDSAFDRITSQHFQDHILCTDPIWKLSGKFHSPNLWHGEVERMPGNCHGDIQSTGSNCQHSERARRGRMTVGAEQCFARLAKVLHVDRMADAVPRTAEPEPKALASTLQKEMIVCILMIG